MAGRPDGEPRAAPLDGFKPLSAFEGTAGARKPLWGPYLPPGSFGLVEGDPGVGKSMLLQKVAADLSWGRRPGPSPALQVVGEPQATLLLTAEESIPHRVVPRLARMGANQAFIHTRDSVRQGRLVLDSGGLALLRAGIERVQPVLCVMDPLQSFAPRGLVTGKPLRDFADALVALADDTGCTIVCVRHFSKGHGRNAVTAGYGGIDLFAAARFVLVVGMDPEEPGQRVMAQSKNSDGPPGPSLGFTITEDQLFAWTETRDVSAEDVLAGAEKGGALAEAKDYLRKALRDGPRLSDQVNTEATGQWHISRSTLTRAKKALDIDCERLGLPGRRGGGVWVMKLRDQEWPDEGTLRGMAEEAGLYGAQGVQGARGDHAHT
jgi:hypothetical protein